MSELPSAARGPAPGLRWFRGRSLRIALLVGVIEASLVVLNVVGWFVVVLVAAAVWALYLYLRRRLAPGPARELAWLAAVSQVVPVLVPVLVGVVKVVALTLFVLFALVLVVVLALDRR